MKKVKIAPSILSADFSILGKQVAEVENGGADLIHVDVMDGHFVPNITVGPLIVSAIKKCTSLPLDVHLMIENPEFYIEDFIEAGADMLSVHLEACTHLYRVIKRIKSCGHVKVGVAVNPATALTNLVNVLAEIDFVLVMSVDPGFGGQDFIPQTLDKVKFLKNKLEEDNLAVEIEVDGGVNVEHTRQLKEAGVDILVAGSAIFDQEDISKAIQDLSTAI